MSSRLALAPVLAEANDERRGDRRRTDRRAARRTFDPLFAATLVNQIAPAETTRPFGYQAPHGPRAGIAFNLSA
jgi:hypothetical protein